MESPAVRRLVAARPLGRLRAVPPFALSGSQLLYAAPALCGCVAIAACLVAAIFRLSYPFPLVSTEEISIEQVQRILNGQHLYVAPTLAHVPLIYGPVYYYLSAGFALVFGLSYLPLRLVSVLASVGSLVLLAYLVRFETRHWMTGIAAAGLLAATFPISATFDAAHVDALFVFLLIAGTSIVRSRSGWVAPFAGGVLIALASLTKVPIGAAPVAAALALYLLATDRRGATLFVIACAVTVAIGVLPLRLQNGSWATWYLFDLPSMHAINNHGDGLGRFWFADILPRFGLALMIGPVFLLGRSAMRNHRPLMFYVLVCGSLLATGWAARSNSGGAGNVLLPSLVAVALLFGLGVDGLLGLLAGRQLLPRLLRTYVLALCVAQFALLAYNPRLMVPYRSEEWAADRLSATLGGLDGELFAPNLDGYVRGTSKGEQPYIGAVLEITGSYGGRGTSEGEQWKGNFASALQQRRFSHVVLIEDCCGMSAALAQAGYISTGPLFPPDDEYWLWTNGRTPSDIQVFVPPGS